MYKEHFSVRPLFLRPAVTLYHWARGAPWDEVVRLSELEEGNLAMLMMRTADNLRHTANLIDVFPDASTTAREAIGLIMKEPVVEGSDEGEARL